MKKLALTFGLAALASLALIACGSSSSDTTSAPATTPASSGGGGGSSSGGGGASASSSIKLAADPSEIAYDTDSLSAKAGNVTIDFDNPNSALGHDVCVQDSSGKKLGCSQVVTGSNTTLDLSNLKAGDYTFYCSVDSHEAAGMKGTLKVQ